MGITLILEHMFQQLRYSLANVSSNWFAIFIFSWSESESSHVLKNVIFTILKNLHYDTKDSDSTSINSDTKIQVKTRLTIFKLLTTMIQDLVIVISFFTKRISTFIVIDMKTESINEPLFLRNKKLSCVFSIYIVFQKLSILIRVCVHHMSNFRSASFVFWTIIIMILLTEMLILFHQQMFFEVTVEYVLRS